MYSISSRRKGSSAAVGEATAPVLDDEVNKGHGVPSVREETWWTFPTWRLDGILTNEALVPWLVFAVALFTRFYRLSEPPGVVFDESHFGRFTNQYTARTYFFDIHPPLGKLMFWFVGYLVGYNHPPGQNPSQRPYLGLDTDCKYEHISEAYAPECKFAWLRGVSAAHSSLTCLLMYLIGRRWSGTTWGGLMAAGLLIFDMLNHIEGRLVLMDVQLIFWCTASLYVAIRWWDRLNEHAEGEDAVAAGRPPPYPLLTLRDRLAWAVVLGLCCGNAFSVKMTGLATPALIGMESALGIWFLRRPARWLDLVTVLVTGFAIYLAYFALHFHLLTRHGDGDDEFMNLAFRKTILENKDYEPGAVWEGFWKTVIDLNIRMVVHNANILEPHPWQSKWWEWVFNLRGVSYYGQDRPHTYTDHMYLIGNHAIHWSVIVGLVGFLALTAFYFRYRSAPHFSAWLPTPALYPYFAQASFALAVYALNMAPYVAVARSTFAYHYMPALVYGELIVARSIQVLAGPRYTPMAAKLYLAAVGLVWLHYTPWIYGMGLTNDGHQRRRWIERWN